MEQIINSTLHDVLSNSTIFAHFEKRRTWLIGRSCSNTSDFGCSSGDSYDLDIFGRMVTRTVGQHHRAGGKHSIMRGDEEIHCADKMHCGERVCCDKGMYYGKKDHYAPKIWKKIGCFFRDCNGDAVVEATILFPIMILIFAALVLLSLYLPVQATLQRATQYAVTAIATEQSDTWLTFDDNSMSYGWFTHKSDLSNVYAELFSGSGNVQTRAETIVTYVEGRGISVKAGTLNVHAETVNRVIYKEVVVSATREIPVVINLSLIGFPSSISITAESRAVVQNGDEFVRNIDLAGDFVEFIADKFELDNVSEAISDFGTRIKSILGW